MTELYALDFKVMGCETRVVLDSEAPGASAALESVAVWLVECERRLSRFDSMSALSTLNDFGWADHVDEVLWDAVDAALRAASETDGLVTPTVLAALEAAGYDRSFDALEREQGNPLGAPRVPDWKGVERDPETRSIRLPAGVRLDLGGTAKGWCADAAASRLSVLGPALVDIGGDVSMSEATRDPWPIAIEDPRGTDEPLDVVLVPRGGVATSGRNVRRWRRAGIEQHHVIDPRTGAPARTDVLTASVIAGRALDAELAAKRVLLEGSEAGLAWIDSRPELAAIVVRDDGHVLRSRRFESHSYRSAS